MQDASAAHARAPFPTEELCETIRRAAAHRSDLAAFFADMVDAMFLSTMNGMDKSDAWSARETAYMAIVKRHPREAVEAMVKVYAKLSLEYPLLRSDPLGDLYMGLGLGQTGQVFTPWSVSTLTAGLAFGGDRAGIDAAIDDRGHVHMSDPASGSGALGLAAASEFREMGYDPRTQLFITAQDNSERCWKMTWLAMTLAGLAGVAIHGDTLDDNAPRQSAVTPEGRIMMEREMMETKGEVR